MRAQYCGFLAGLALLPLGLAAHSQQGAASEADERLNARAPVAILDRPLEEALPELAGPRRVTLTTAPDLGAQRVTVIARERSLREVMEAVR